MKRIKIGNKELFNYSEPYIIAEIGANHNGDMKLALEMIDLAKDAGADAIKFQSWQPGSINSAENYKKHLKYTDSPKKHFGSLYEMDVKYHLSFDQHAELKTYCDEKDIAFCSTPFTSMEADMLRNLDVSFVKIASMDINNIQLLSYVADMGLPIVLSTGMSTMAEIERAIGIIEEVGNKQIILLHCISIYPPEYEDIHLRNILMLQKAFPYPVGFSDHSIGTSVPIASVAFGACIIEKHFTLDKSLPGWDHAISADPKELREIIVESRNIHKALGNFQRTVSEAEIEKKSKFRRSLVLTRDAKAGEILIESDLASKRPGSGIQADEIQYVIGRKLLRDISADEHLSWEDLV